MPTAAGNCNPWPATLSERNFLVLHAVVVATVQILVVFDVVGLLLVTDELELAADDLGAVSRLAVLVVGRRANLTLDKDLLALGQVLGEAFGLLVEERHAVPFGQLLLVAGLVLERLVCRESKLEDGHATCRDPQLGVCTQVSHQNDFVHFFTAMYFS